MELSAPRRRPVILTQVFLAMVLLGLPGQVLAFYPFTLPHHMMVGRVMKTLFLVDRLNCIHECHMNEQCFSYNFEPSKDGKGSCELNKCGVKDNHEREKSLIYTRGVLFQQIRPSQVVSKNGSVCWPKPVNGKWTKWTACSVTCGVGLQSRDKTCTNPSSTQGGKGCSGTANETRRCGNKKCTGRTSCENLYKLNMTRNGVYNITPAGLDDVIPVFCDQESVVGGGRWTMVFKVVSGVPDDPLYVWRNTTEYNQNKTQALGINNNYKGHYKNIIATDKNWALFDPSQARVALYNNSKHLMSIIFNATGSTSENWFAADRVLSSPWKDLSKQKRSNKKGFYFSIEGENRDPSKCTRRFLINRKYDKNCDADEGWLVVTYVPTCSWEKGILKNTPMFSNLSTSTIWNTKNNVGVADVMVVYIK